MKKFFKTKFLVTVITEGEPLEEVQVRDRIEGVFDDGDEVTGVSDVNASRISARAAAQFTLDQDEDPELLFEIDEDGNDLEESEEDEEEEEPCY